MKLSFLVSLLLVGVISASKSGSGRNHVNTQKHKRGIYGGYHHGYSGYPETGLGLAPFGYARPWAPNVYSGYPNFVRPVVSPLPASPYAITHGGASVQSYNVNYPRYPFLQQKPIFGYPPVSAAPQFLPASYPQFQYPQYPIPAPVAPAPVPIPAPLPAHVYPQTFFIPQKPIIPIAVPALPVAPTFNRPVIIQKPLAPVLPAAPINPIFSFASFQPQFVPIPIPTQPSTTTTTTTTAITPTISTSSRPNQIPGQSGINFVTNVIPSRPYQPPVGPVTTTHFLPTPTQSTGQSFPRPPISLLPPYQGPTGPGFSNFNGAFTPTNSPQSIGGIDQQQNNNHEFNQGNQHNRGYPSGPFNGQAYGPPSNNGRFIGPSSYQVRLNSRREY